MGESPGTAREAFELLANGTRLAIVRELGDESDADGYGPLPFSTLQERVGAPDSGGFSYHLNKLVGRFVERTPGGYALTPPGIWVYQAIVVGAYAEPVTVEPVRVDVECLDCYRPMTAWYEEYRFHLGCRHCDDLSFRYPLPPGSFDPASPESLVAAGSNRLRRDYQWMGQGYCPYCSGAVERSVTPDKQGLDDPQAGHHETTAHFVCTRCNWFLHASPNAPMALHPAVVAFYYERGVDPYELSPWGLPGEVDEEVLSTEPCRVALTYRLDGDARRLVVDDELDVVSVEDD